MGNCWLRSDPNRFDIFSEIPGSASAWWKRDRSCKSAVAAGSPYELFIVLAAACVALSCCCCCCMMGEEKVPAERKRVEAGELRRTLKGSEFMSSLSSIPFNIQGLEGGWLKADVSLRTTNLNLEAHSCPGDVYLHVKPPRPHLSGLSSACCATGPRHAVPPA